MNNKPGKIVIVLLMILATVLALVFQFNSFADSGSTKNYDLNDPNDPIQDTCWLHRGQAGYAIDEMRPLITGTTKHVYTDPSYKEQYRITEPAYPVAPNTVINLWVKFFQVLWNGDTQSKYYIVEVHGPVTTDAVYMASLAGKSTHPLTDGEGTADDPFTAAIAVPNSKATITTADITMTNPGQPRIFTSDSFGAFTSSVALAEGTNLIHIGISNEDNTILIYYIITVIREAGTPAGPEYVIVFDANGGTGTMEGQPFTLGEEQELRANAFRRANYTFIGWATSATGPVVYEDKGTFIFYMVADGGVVTLYAVWAPVDIDRPGIVSPSTKTPAPIKGIEDDPPPLDPFISDHVAYIIGYPEGDVRPGNNITRAEVATVFFRLLEDGVRATNWTRSNAFTDVNAGNWFNNAVSVMSKMEIVNGYSDGAFKPNGAITRPELTVIAARFARIMKMESKSNSVFTDISGHWAQDDIVYVASTGWLNGYPDGTFRPDRLITRAEFVTLVNRMLGRIPQTPDDLLANGMVTWADNADRKAWFYLAIQEATNSHVHGYKEERVPELEFEYEYWKQMLKNPDWAKLEKEWAVGNMPPSG